MSDYQRIKEHIGDPEKLEQLYREDRNGFESGFEEVYSETEKSELLRYWRIRLDYNKLPVRQKKLTGRIFTC